MLELKAMVTSLFLLSPSAGCLVGIKVGEGREEGQQGLNEYGKEAKGALDG